MTDNEQSFEEWEVDGAPSFAYHNSDYITGWGDGGETAWDNRTAHYEAKLAEKDVEIAGLRELNDSMLKTTKLQLNRIAELEAQQQWVRVDEPPEDVDEDLLIRYHWLDNGNESAYTGIDEWCYATSRINPIVTHWMPLPTPPQEDTP